MKYIKKKSRMIFFLLTVVANTVFAQQTGLENIYQRVLMYEAPDDFRQLYDVINTSEEIPDSVKMTMIAEVSQRTKKLKLDYYYARFRFYESIILTK